ncbi:MAG: hypothetical protein QOD66_3632 [Solirubrobacteraceae bacterium]|jgi:hypothetical protein|nr:hypothetical protein [Solirubrobacteraceae bacterium]
MQMFMIALKDGYSDEKSRDVQRQVREHGGFILMSTRTGPLVALPEAALPRFAKHPLVSSVGAVTLNPRGFAADRLARVFAENLSRQVEFEASGETNPPP